MEQKQLNILLGKTSDCVRVGPVIRPINADAVILVRAGEKNVVCVTGDEGTELEQTPNGHLVQLPCDEWGHLHLH